MMQRLSLTPRLDSNSRPSILSNSISRSLPTSPRETTPPPQPSTSKSIRQGFANKIRSVGKYTQNVTLPLNLKHVTINVVVIGCEGSGKTLLLRSLSRYADAKMKLHKEKLLLRKGFKGIKNLSHINNNGNNSNGSEYEASSLPLSTTPTIGVENKTTPHTNSKSIKYIEIGGCMNIMWDKYITGANEVITFVIDGSSVERLCNVKCELLTLIHSLNNINNNIISSTTKRRHKPLAIIINKLDITSHEDVVKFYSFLRLKEMCYDYIENANGESNASNGSRSDIGSSAGSGDLNGSASLKRVARVFQVSAKSGLGVEEYVEWVGGLSL